MLRKTFKFIREEFLSSGFVQGYSIICSVYMIMYSFNPLSRVRGNYFPVLLAASYLIVGITAVRIINKLFSGNSAGLPKLLARGNIRVRIESGKLTCEIHEG